MQPIPTDFQALRFSSAAFPRRQRVDAWRDFFGPKIFGAEIEPVSEQPYHSDLTVRCLPGVNMLSAVNSPARFVRSRAMLSDGCVDFGLHINSRPTVLMQHGREMTYAAGEPLLLTAAEPGFALAPSRSHFLCLHIDRAALAPFLTHPDDALPRRLGADNPVLRYLLGYVRFLEQTNVASTCPSVASMAAIHLRDLFALLMGAKGDAAVLAEHGGLYSARMVAMKRFIEERLGDPSVNVVMVAAGHGVSVRSVQRMFERQGTTFSEYVLNQRLVRAHRVLTDPRNAKMSVMEIALDSGFGDLSYFNRCFRRRFGGPPRWFRGSGNLPA